MSRLGDLFSLGYSNIRVIKAIGQPGRANRRLIYKTANVSKSSISVYLGRLRDRGYIKRSGKRGWWGLTPLGLEVYQFIEVWENARSGNGILEGRAGRCEGVWPTERLGNRVCE